MKPNFMVSARSAAAMIRQSGIFMSFAPDPERLSIVELPMGQLPFRSVFVVATVAVADRSAPVS